MATPAAQAASAAAKNAGFIARLEQGPLRRFLGVEGGVLLRGGPFASLNATSPTFRKFNNALTLAPLWKWGLAIVPLMGVFSGTPSVENLDVNTSIALASTGAIWAYYSTLVRPKSDTTQHSEGAVSLGVVSIALLGANGYNVYRRYDYEQKKKAGLLPAQTVSTSTSTSALVSSQEPLLAAQVGNKALAA